MINSDSQTNMNVILETKHCFLIRFEEIVIEEMLFN